MFYRGFDTHLLHAFDFNISASALGQNYISIIYMYVELFRILDLPIMYIFLGLILENKKRILLEIKKFWFRHFIAKKNLKNYLVICSTLQFILLHRLERVLFSMNALLFRYFFCHLLTHHFKKTLRCLRRSQ